MLQRPVSSRVTGVFQHILSILTALPESETREPQRALPTLIGNGHKQRPQVQRLGCLPAGARYATRDGLLAATRTATTRHHDATPRRDPRHDVARGATNRKHGTRFGLCALRLYPLGVVFTSRVCTPVERGGRTATALHALGHAHHPRLVRLTRAAPARPGGWAPRRQGRARTIRPGGEARRCCRPPRRCRRRWSRGGGQRSPW